MNEKRFIFHKYDGEVEDTETQEFHEVDKYHFDYMIVEKMNTLADENKELKDLLKSMTNRNGEIRLNNGQIIRLKKIFKGEWVND